MRPITDFDLTITRAALNELAPALVDTLREFVSYGTCKQGNTHERKALAERFAKLAYEAIRQFPDLKLNHVGARTVVTGPDAYVDATQGRVCASCGESPCLDSCGACDYEAPSRGAMTLRNAEVEHEQ